MKVVITAQGKDLSSQLDSRFGRAKWLIIYDTDKDSIESKDNTPNLNAVSGAGIQTAQNVGNLGAEAVITGNVGPNAFKTLDAAKVKVFLCKTNTVQEALDLFKKSKLQQITAANVEGHWI